MEKITGKQVESMMEAYASVYNNQEQQTLSEGYGKGCVKKEKKTKHNCAKKVCSEQWGEGTCVPEHHTLLEDGTVTHYDVVFKHGLERMVPVEELEVLVTEMHEHAAMEGEYVDENVLNYLGGKFKKGADQIGGFFNRFSPAPGINPNRPFSGRGAGRSSFRDSNIPANSGIKQSGGGLNQGEKPKPPGGDKKPPLTAKDKAYGPNSTLNKDQQAVNREYDRLRKSDPEAAAVYGKKMAAKGAANKDFKLEKPTQAQSSPTAAQKQASVDAAIKRVNRPENMNKPAPAGTALRAQQDKQAAAKVAAAAPKPRPMGARNAMRAPGGIGGGRPAPKPAASAGGYQLPAGAKPLAVSATVKKPVAARPMSARNRMRMEEVDIFDTIKEYLIGEGATEEEALKQMLQLTDEQRTEIIEGSCGSKKKKKGGYGK